MSKPDLSKVKVVGRFEVVGRPGLVEQHTAEVYLRSAWSPYQFPGWLFNSYEGIDTDLPEGEYYVVRER